MGYASITTFNLQQDTETSIKFTWAASKACDAIQYSLNGGSWTGGVYPTTTISGLSAYTQYSVKIRVKAQDSQLWTESSVKYVTTYNYPYCTSRPDFKIGSKLNLQFYNPLNRTMQIQMWSHKSQSFVSDLISVTGTSYSGFDNIKDRLYASIPSDTESKYNIDVHYSGHKAINEGGKYSINGNEYPVFNNFTYEDTNSKTKALTENNQILINGYSNLKVTISTDNKAYSNYGSPIDKYRLNVGNMSSVEKAYNASAAVELAINSINSPSITVTAIDKRSYPKQQSKTATFKAYFKPIIKSIAASRSEGGVGSQVTLSFDGEWWNDNFGKVANSINNISYYYKKTTETNWTKGNISIIPIINGNNFSGSALIEGPNYDKGFDITIAYNIKLIVTDQLDSSNEYQTILSTGAPALAIYDNKVSIGLKYDENLGGALQVKGEVIEQGLRVGVNQPELKEKVWIRKSKNYLNKNNYFIDSSGYVAFVLDLEYGKTYTLSSNKPLYVAKFAYNSYDTNNNVGPQTWNEFTKWTFVAGQNTNGFLNSRLYLGVTKNTLSTNISDFNDYNLQVEEGTSVTQFEEYADNALFCRNGNGLYEKLYKYKLVPLTINTNYVSNSDLDYVCLKIGKIVILNIYSIAFIAAIDNYVDFMYGLPRPTNYRVFYIDGGASAARKFS